MSVTLDKIKTYEGGKSNIPGKKNIIKLSSNESPFGPSRKVLKAIKQASGKTNRYPNADSLELKKNICKRYKVPTKNIFVGNGSDEILGLLCQLFLSKNDEVIIPKHSFLMYEIYASINNAKIKYSNVNDYSFIVDDIIKKVTNKTKIIFIAQPNNPTGIYLDRKNLNKLLKRIPKRIMVVIDAAYSEFINNSDYTDGLNLVMKNRNIIVTHTFSKIYGLASLRLGWCAAPERIINLLDRIRGPFNVNQIAQVAGSAALSDTNYEKKVIRHNTIWLKKFKSELAKFPVKVYDSQANFIFIKVRNATKLNKYLLSNGIIVRTLDNYEIFDCLRISIGTTLENKKFLNLIKKFFENE